MEPACRWSQPISRGQDSFIHPLDDWSSLEKHHSLHTIFPIVQPWNLCCLSLPVCCDVITPAQRILPPVGRDDRGRILRSSCCLTFSQSAARRLKNYESTRLIIFPSSFITTEEKNRNNFPVIERRITGSCRVWCLRPVWRVVYGYSLRRVCQSTLHFFFWICWCQYSVLLIFIYIYYFSFTVRAAGSHWSRVASPPPTQTNSQQTASRVSVWH